MPPKVRAPAIKAGPKSWAGLRPTPKADRPSLHPIERVAERLPRLFEVVTHCAIEAAGFGAVAPATERRRIARRRRSGFSHAANAYQMNMETKLGSIERGKLADLVVPDKDYMEVSDDELKKIKSVLTVVDGKIIHNKVSG